jgi:hypothetical protein
MKIGSDTLGIAKKKIQNMKTGPDALGTAQVPPKMGPEAQT